LQRLGPIGERNPMLNMQPIAVRGPLGQVGTGLGFAGQGRVLFFGEGFGAWAQRLGVAFAQQC
jgi:hypothetical protein